MDGKEIGKSILTEFNLRHCFADITKPIDWSILSSMIDTAISQAKAEERERCCEAIRAACEACGGQGGTCTPKGIVTREMAMDAGEPMMEGQPIYGESVECEYCGRPIAAIRALE